MNTELKNEIVSIEIEELEQKIAPGGADTSFLDQVSGIWVRPGVLAPGRFPKSHPPNTNCELLDSGQNVHASLSQFA